MKNQKEKSIKPKSAKPKTTKPKVVKKNVGRKKSDERKVVGQEQPEKEEKLRMGRKILAAIVITIILIILFIKCEGGAGLGTTIANNAPTIVEFDMNAANKSKKPYVIGTPMAVSWKVTPASGVKSVTLLAEKGGTYTEVVTSSETQVVDETFGIRLSPSEIGKNLFRLTACGFNGVCQSADLTVPVAKAGTGELKIDSFRVKGPVNESAVKGEPVHFSWEVSSEEEVDIKILSAKEGTDLSTMDGDGDRINDATDTDVKEAIYKYNDGKTITALPDEEGGDTMGFVIRACVGEKCKNQQATLKVLPPAQELNTSKILSIDFFEATLIDRKGTQFPVTFMWDIKPQNNFKSLELVRVSPTGSANTIVPLKQMNADKDTANDGEDPQMLSPADYAEKISLGKTVHYELRAYDIEGNVATKDITVIGTPKYSTATSQ